MMQQPTAHFSAQQQQQQQGFKGLFDGQQDVAGATAAAAGGSTHPSTSVPSDTGILSMSGGLSWGSSLPHLAPAAPTPAAPGQQLLPPPSAGSYTKQLLLPAGSQLGVGGHTFRAGPLSQDRSDAAAAFINAHLGSVGQAVGGHGAMNGGGNGIPPLQQAAGGMTLLGQQGQPPHDPGLTLGQTGSSSLTQLATQQQQLMIQQQLQQQIFQQQQQLQHQQGQAALLNKASLSRNLLPGRRWVGG